MEWSSKIISWAPLENPMISSHPSSHPATWVHTFASGLFSKMPSSKASKGNGWFRRNKPQAQRRRMVFGEHQVFKKWHKKKTIWYYM